MREREQGRVVKKTSQGQRQADDYEQVNVVFMCVCVSVTVCVIVLLCMCKCVNMNMS